MGIQPQIALYNQVHGTDESFVAAFVARLEVLETLVASLNVIVETGTSNHYMLVGARGMGKSSLLRRLGIAIAETETLSAHFMPLRFREEQYNVTSLAAFWGNCGEALADWAEQNDLPDLAAEMDSAIASPDWKDAAMAERQFLAACQKAGNRRPVLLVDNLDLIVDGIKTNEQWALRSVLQSEGGPILIGAATQFLAQAADREAPFYEFYYPIILEPLSEPEVLACLRALAGARPETSGPVLRILNQEPERLRTLYTLTGGNPRVLALIYLLLEREETETIFQDLEKLLDQVTPYYKSRVEEYQTAQQRAVIDAIALQWDPILSRDITKVTGIAPTTISGLLLKLRREGFIQEVQTSGALAGYQISERFLNIWYLMRHGTRRTKVRLKWLSIFLARLYSASELAGMAQEARADDGTCRWHPHYREAVLEAEAYRNSEIEKSTTEKNGTFLLANTLFVEALAHGLQNRNKDAIIGCDEIVARFGASTDPKFQLLVAKTLVNKGVALSKLNQKDKEILVYDEVLSRYGTSTQLALRRQVAMALVNKGITLAQLKRSEDAISVYDQVEAREGVSVEPTLQELVARALVNKGFLLSQASQSDEAFVLFDEIVARFGSSNELALQKQVAMGLVSKALTLDRLGQADKAILLYDVVAAQHGETTEPELKELVAIALSSKACHQIEAFGDLTLASISFQKALDLDSDSFSAIFANQAWVHILQGQADDAESQLGRAQDLSPLGVSLLKAGIDIARDNLGNGLSYLRLALEQGFDGDGYDFFPDLLWLLRLCETRGYGQRILEWLAETGFADKYAPLTVAFNAYVKGERFLLDSNPEVRGAAQTLYDRMDRHRKYKANATKKGKA